MLWNDITDRVAARSFLTELFRGNVFLKLRTQKKLSTSTYIRIFKVNEKLCFIF